MGFLDASVRPGRGVPSSDRLWQPIMEIISAEGSTLRGLAGILWNSCETRSEHSLGVGDSFRLS